MNAKDFITESLVRIANEISQINIRYAYDEITNFHIIEISPEEIRRGDEKYMEMEYELWNNFRTMFPHEDILICEISDTNNMDNILFEKKAPISISGYTSCESSCVIPDFDGIYQSFNYTITENNYTNTIEHFNLAA